jgi:predicted dehydrogenase
MNCKNLRTLSRRTFFGVSAAQLGAASATLASGTSGAGANDRLGVGLIGVGGRGLAHLAILKEMARNKEGVQIVAVNDAYGPRLRKAAELAGGVKTYRHHQELLADKAVDVVCIASPDRLHVPQAMDAIRAGKDVYCEKPMGHWSQFELSKQFYKETIKRKRIVQIGNQGNSSAAWRKVGELVREGAIGKPQHVQAGFYRDGDWGERMPIPDPHAQPGPDLDWDAFLGDAPRVSFSVDRFFSWRKYLDYAGGPCTDLFPHVFTPFVSILGLTFPATVAASGGIFKYDTYDREVPDTFNLCMDFPQKLSVTIVCTLANDYQSEPVIRGDQGAITLQNPVWEGGFESVTVIPKKGTPKRLPGEKPNCTLAHWRNFIDCVRTRQKPVSDVEYGLRVQAAISMGMLGFLNKKIAQFDFSKESILL